MTAFAREERQDEWGSASWEVRSVNFRYLDVGVRLPDELRHLEPAIRERVTRRIGRGKIECTLRYQPVVGGGGQITVNLDLAKKLAAAGNEIASVMSDAAPMSAIDILRWPGVLEAEPVDTDRIGSEALSLLDDALDDLILSREREGAKLAEMIHERCSKMAVVVTAVRERLPVILEWQRERIRARLAEIREKLDETRLEQEMVLIAQKVDVAEELDRLETHIEEVLRNLTVKKPAGRRLDFLMQELNREANTLGSKSMDPDTTLASVELKVLIEQMREQIQNIE